MNHPRSTALTVTLFTQSQPLLGELDYNVADVLSTMFEGWSEDRKVDLYQRLLRVLRADMTFVAAEKAVSDALRENHKEFPDG